MKKIIKYLGLVLFLNLIFVINVKAASFSVRASSSTVTVGNTVTVTVGVTGASGWEYCINYDSSLFTLTSAPTDTGGKCVKTGSTLIGYSSVKFKFKANKSGTGTFSLAGAAAYNDDGALLTSSFGSAKVTARTQQEIQASYSNNAYLKSLSIEGYDLTPAFNKNETNYSLEVPNDVESVTINAVKDESHASVSGSGNIQLSEGLNKIVITVTAQKGNVKKYNIDITRKELNPINVKVEGKDYSVVRKKELLTAPNLFAESTTMINDEEVVCFKNEATNLTLVGLKNESGDINLYIYDGVNYSLFKEYSTDAITLIPYETDKLIEGFEKNKKINIGQIEITAYYQNENNDLVLVYGMNLKNGEKSWYTYDTKDLTLQKFYENNNLEIKNSKKDTYFILSIVFGAGLIVSVLLVIILLLVNARIKGKNKKLIALLEERKNKENKSKAKVDEVEDKKRKKIEDEKELDKEDEEDIDDKDEIEKESVTTLEEEIINNIAESNEKSFYEEEMNDETTTNDIIDDVTLESSIIRDESNVLSKKDLKRLAKEQKKLQEQAKKEFLDDKTFVNSAFDKYVREETEVLPVVTSEEVKKKISKKSKKKGK